jgi:hypothetical protein
MRGAAPRTNTLYIALTPSAPYPPTITSAGKRIPGLKLDHPRHMHALVRFAHIAAGNTFTTAEIHPALRRSARLHP